MLIGRGATVNAVNGTGNTPLHLAAMEDRSEIVSLLLSRRADPKIENSKGETAADVARKRKIRDMILRRTT